MITLRAIHLADFLSHKKTTIDFSSHARVLIDGESGSGKSSVVDALIWCLYGVGRADNRSLIRAGQEKMSVQLDLTVDPDFDGKARNYTITRSVSAKGKHAIDVFMEVEGQYVPINATGTREIQQWIEHDFLEASYELFVNSVVYPQGGSESFVEASSVRRKDLLLEILNVDEIDAYYDKIRTGIKDAEMSMAEDTGELRAIDTRISQLESMHEDTQFIEIQLSSAEYELRDAEKKHAETTVKLERNREDAQAIDQLTKERDRLDGEVKVASADLSLHREMQETLMCQLEDLSPDYAFNEAYLRQEFSRVEQEMRDAVSINYERASIIGDQPKRMEYESRIVDTQRQLDRITKDLPTCPSGDECPFVQRAQPEQQYLVDQIETFKQKQSEQQDQFAAWEARLAAAPVAIDVSQVQRDYDNLKLVLGKMDNIDRLGPIILAKEGVYNDLSNKFEDILVRLDKNETRSALITHLAEALGVLTKQIEEAKEVIEKSRTILTLAKQREEELTDLQGRRVVVNDRIVKTLEINDKLVLLKDAFGSNGIRAIAIDQLIPRFEEKINEVLAQMSDFRIRLDTQRKNVKGETTIEGLFLMVRNDQGQEFEFNSYSGGEKLKVTVAISEALASMQRAGFRILDELFVGLDESSTEAFANVLSEIQGRFSQMVCISHLRQIKDLFDERVVVTKINGISSVKHG